MMSNIKKNIIANFVGNAWVALMSLAFIPINIHLMGIEAYGLIGFLVTMQAVFSVFDMGLGATMNREVARLSELTENVQGIRNLARTLEWTYWAIAILIGVTVIVFAPFISGNWLQSSEIAPETIWQAVVMMGFIIGLRLPSSLYSGGLMGLQRQVLYNVLKTFLETLRSGGAVLILWLVSPSIQAYLTWQIITTGLATFSMGWLFWNNLPGPKIRAEFQPLLIRNIWHFTAGMAGISIMSAILSNMDKIILSRMLSLETFGYFMVANAIATALFFVISPVYSAILPRLTQLVASGNSELMVKTYHQGSQFMAVIVLPVATVIALFSPEILVLWTSSPQTANQAHNMTSILIVGMALSGMMHIPYALLLAHGWTKIHFLWTLASVLTLAPLMIFLTKFFGQTGAVIATVLVSASYILCVVPHIHKRLVPGALWKWYIVDNGLPLAAAIAVASIARFLITGPMNNIYLICEIFLTYLITVVAAMFAAPQIRVLFINMMAKIILRKN